MEAGVFGVTKAKSGTEHSSLLPPTWHAVAKWPRSNFIVVLVAVQLAMDKSYMLFTARMDRMNVVDPFARGW